MSSRFPLLTSIAVLAIAGPASGNLILGYHDFDGLAAPTLETPDYNPLGLDSSITESDPGINTPGQGSQDGTYGPVPTPSAGAGYDGYGKVAPNKSLILSVTNNTGVDIDLAALVFDATSRAGGVKEPGAGYVLVNGIELDFTNDATGWEDYSLSLVGTTLADAATITFTFVIPAGNLFWIDNIGLTQIPESAGAMALLVLLAAPMLLRYRRRALVVA